MGGGEYRGQFVDGRMCGQGVFTWANGAVYEGSFVDNKVGRASVHPCVSWCGAWGATPARNPLLAGDGAGMLPLA